MGALATPQVIDRYAVYGKIASGGMASVCFGRLLGGEGFARTVAIKRLHPHLAEDPEFRATLIDEARMAARIHHPNVVPTLDVVTAGGELLVVMEYVRGESLARLLKIERGRGRRVPLPIVSAIVSGSLHGLHAAHEATNDAGAPLDIVHRDVSPQNLLVGVDGLARVIDFGVAKAAGRLQTTREGSIKGKIAYMAPEQIAGRDVTRTADVYAMGVVLWEMLTGERLFQGDNDIALVSKVIAGVEDAPSSCVDDLPPGLDELVMRALAGDPADRFATAQDMATRLVRLVTPAMAIDVGRWVEEAARATLSQRGAELAEIESSSGISGISMVPAPVSSRVMHTTGSHRAFVPPPPASTPAAALQGDGLPPTIISQPSSVSRAAPSPMAITAAPPTASPARSQRALWAVGMGLAALLGLGLAALLRGGAATQPAPVRASATTAPASTQAAAAEGPNVPAAPPATGILTGPVVPVTSLPVAAVPVSSLPPVTPVGSAGARPAPHSPTHTAATSPAPAAAKPKTGCNPPYVIDSAGDRQYKPECL